MKDSEKLAFVVTIFPVRKLKPILSRIFQLGELDSKSSCSKLQSLLILVLHLKIVQRERHPCLSSYFS